MAAEFAHDRDTGSYILPRPAPGRYILHVKIDENRNKPARFPGDHDVFHRFVVTADTPRVLPVDVPKLMHLVWPWDNDKNLDGMLTRPWSEKPAIEIRPRSRPRDATVTFKWNAVTRDAEYTYVILASRDSPYESGPEVIRGKTRKTQITLRLPHSREGEYFQFGLSAHKAGHQVGELFTHEADPDDRSRLILFNVERFFSHNQRTDNCAANCKVGDLTARMVQERPVNTPLVGSPKPPSSSFSGSLTSVRRISARIPSR